MSSYIPYEQRRQAASDGRRMVAHNANTYRATLVRDIRTFLPQVPITGSAAGSVAYLEVLKPARKYARRLKRDSLIWKDQAVGGPYFEIAQVLTACRIDNAIVEQSERARDASSYMPVIPTISDALMLPDGGFWVESKDSHWSHRVAERTYQVLSADRWSIDDPHVTTESLVRIAKRLYAALHT